MEYQWWYGVAALLAGFSFAVLLPAIAARIRGRGGSSRRTKTPAEMLDRFKKEVCEKSMLINSESKPGWFDLSMGFFLACGATPNEAYALAVEAKEREYWAARRANEQL